jgi:membrane-bound lytic murein transglycosylase B
MNRAPAVVATVVVGAVIIHPGLLAPVHRLDPVVSALTAAVSRAGHHHPKPAKARGRDGIPGDYRALYRHAAAHSSCGVSWRVLAGIGKVESDHGRNAVRSSAGAQGPMQFMPATWRAYGVDGNRDGRKDIHDPEDAIPAAAGYLCANRAGRNLSGAIWHYNHSAKYVNDVLAERDRLR